MAEMTELKRTPLYAEHERLGAKLVPFAGFVMPVQYPTGIIAEHLAVRRRAGLFDVSHMGEVDVTGPQALALVQSITTNDAGRLEVGQAQYSVMCRDDGGAIDDCLVYRLADRFMVVVNAANHDVDVAWMQEQAAGFDAQVIDRSDETALIAVQGPRAQALLAPLADSDLDAIAYYHFMEGEVDGRRALISRTGYTGEDGFELYVAPEDAASIWRRLLQNGGGIEVMPAGLGARDSLRLEMGYILYGNDLDLEHTPLEAGLGWVVKLDKGEFHGRDALKQQKVEGLRRRLIGFRLGERGFPRPGYEIHHADDAVGHVTSGVLSPSLEVGVGLAYVPPEVSKVGTSVGVAIRGRTLPAEVVRPPFYTAGSIRR
jgi:glycine cleavage system T protein (aminomethyltransferase)